MRPGRYLRFAGRIAADNLERPRFPYKVLISLTNRCNFRCRTCGIWRMKSGDELSLGEIRDFISRSRSLSWVHLTGGEVFLRKDFTEIVKRCVTGLPGLLLLNFPTDGYLTDRILEGVRRIVSFRPERLFITVSMDGDEALNDEIRGVRGGWRRQIETFRRLRGIPDVEVALGMTLSPFNLHGFPRAFAAAKEVIPSLTYQDFHMNLMHVSARYGNEEQPLSAPDLEAMRTDVENYRKLRGLSLRPAALLEWGYLRLAGRYLATGRTPVRCHALRASCFIGPNGTVYPCSTWDHPLGNLREHDYDLARIWNSEEARRVQREIWEGRCPHCWTPCEAYQSLLGNLFRRNPA